MKWNIIFGIVVVGLTTISSVIARSQTAPSSGINYFAPTKQANAPQEVWTRNLGTSALLGSLVPGKSGDLYVGYWDRESYASRYDRNGKLLWRTSFSRSDGMTPALITANPNGELFLQRTSAGGLLLSRLLPNGKLVNKVPLPNGSFAVDANGACVVDEFRGEGPGGLNGKEYLSKYSPTGKLEWSTFLQDTNLAPTLTPIQIDLAVDAKGNTYLLMAELAGGCLRNGMLSKYQPDGKLVWSKQVTTETDTIMAMQLEPSGSIYTVGDCKGLGYYVRKFDPSGENVWTRRPNSKTGDSAVTLEVDRVGNTYVRGANVNSGDFVAKHDLNGQLIWRIKPPKITMLKNMAVSGNELFLAGIVQGKGNLLVIKLSQRSK